MHLNKLIDANSESQREATELRENEAAEYNSEKVESEQCIGALEAAITVLNGAGTKKAGFLETLQEAKLLSVVASVRTALGQRHLLHAVSDRDMELVTQFVARPQDFFQARSGAVSAAQMGQNPFGDYAPQSTQIQGILKAMYDGFASSLEKANAEEGNSVKAFQKLMATQRLERQTLQNTLELQTMDEATKKKALADSRIELDDTKDQLAADEELFEATKTSSIAKAKEWAQRMRLRTEELTGIRRAIAILSNPKAVETFESAHNESHASFLQIFSSSGESNNARLTSVVYARIRDLAKRHHSASLTKVATVVKAGGHFDKVIVMIDHMVNLLRQEEQDDIAHRDRCQAGKDANTNSKEDISSDIGKAGNAISLMEGKRSELGGALNQTKEDISDSQERMADRLQLRNGERSDFTNALKDDADAIALIEQAISALTKFYKNNRISLKLVQRSDPEYTVDNDKAPETIWRGGDYGGRKSESVGIVSILSMIKEDLENEMKTSRQDDAAAEASYEAERAAQQHDLDAQEAQKANIQTTLAEINAKIFSTEVHKDEKQGDLDAEGKLTEALNQDCAWVSSHFDSRRSKRKAEIQGLQEAKDFLAGVDSGTDVELPVDQVGGGR